MYWSMIFLEEIIQTWGKRTISHLAKFSLHPLATLLIFSSGMYYALHLRSVRIHKPWLYWKIRSAEIYRKIIFS